MSRVAGQNAVRIMSASDECSKKKTLHTTQHHLLDVACTLAEESCGRESYKKCGRRGWSTSCSSSTRTWTSPVHAEVEECSGAICCDCSYKVPHARRRNFGLHDKFFNGHLHRLLGPPSRDNVCVAMSCSRSSLTPDGLCDSSWDNVTTMTDPAVMSQTAVTTCASSFFPDHMNSKNTLGLRCDVVQYGQRTRQRSGTQSWVKHQSACNCTTTTINFKKYFICL